MFSVWYSTNVADAIHMARMHVDEAKNVRVVKIKPSLF